ncbi:hypothetical protein ACWCPJ_35940 [Streptomyces collinus]
MTTANEGVATTKDAYPGYKTVADIVNKGVEDALEETVRKLRDPNSFRSAVMEISSRKGIPQEFLNDTESLLRAFWQLATEVTVNIRWTNNSGVPDRDSAYVESITRGQAAALVFDFTISLCS